LEGGCSVPVGVEAFIEELGSEAEAQGVVRPFDKDPEEVKDDAPLLHQSGRDKLAKLHMTACVTSLDGKKQVVHDAGWVLVKGFMEAEEWGHRVARDLMGKGGKEILDEINLVRQQREQGLA
jgi:hydroxymethylbilane synthase